MSSAETLIVAPIVILLWAFALIAAIGLLYCAVLIARDIGNIVAVWFSLDRKDKKP